MQQVVFRGSPMLKVILAFSMGILLQEQLRVSLGILILMDVFFLCTAIFLTFKKNTYGVVSYTLHTFFVYACLIISGALILCLTQTKQQINDIKHIYHEGMQWKGRVSGVTRKNDYDKYSIFLESIQYRDEIFPTRTNILVYDYTHRQIPKGSVIQSDITLVRIKNKAIPAPFDAVNFYGRKGFFYQAFLKEENTIQIVEQAKPEGAAYTLEAIRISIQEKLSLMIKDKDALAIASALLLGKEIQQQIDAAVMDDFKTAGVIHVIVISGMHIGALASIISFILGHIVRSQKTYWRMFVLCITLTFIWAFSLLAGMGVSVLRAAIMFSYIQINDQLNASKQPHFQVLASSAFIVLLIDPYELWDLGFIFSYAAMTGIFLGSDIIQKLVNAFRKYYIISKLTNYILFSLAASIFIIPITAYYFGVFYPYFLLANIFAIPFIGLILMVESIALLFAYTISFIGDFLGMLLEQCILLLNAGIHQIASLPNARIDCSLSYVALCLVVASIFLMIYWYVFKQRKIHLFASLILLLVLVIAQIAEEGHHQNEKIFGVSALHGSIFTYIIEGKNAHLFVAKKHTHQDIENYTSSLKKAYAVKNLRVDTLAGVTQYQMGLYRAVQFPSNSKIDDYLPFIQNAQALILHNAQYEGIINFLKLHTNTTIVSLYNPSIFRLNNGANVHTLMEKGLYELPLD